MYTGMNILNVGVRILFLNFRSHEIDRTNQGTHLLCTFGGLTMLLTASCKDTMVQDQDNKEARGNLLCCLCVCFAAS